MSMRRKRRFGRLCDAVFTLGGHTSNVELDIRTSLSNAWAFYNLALLDENGGTGFEFGREVSYYAGVEDGEAWHEGSPEDKVVLPAVPAGRYYLRVALDRDAGAQPFSYTLAVKRDVPRVSPFFAALVLLALPVLFGGVQFGELRVQPVARERPPLGHHVVRFGR